MKAMILAAGEGRRLQPITNTIPKALVEIKGVSLLEILIHKLINAGISELVINTFYLADQIEDFILKKDSFGINIQISKEDILMDTGGGIKHAAHLLKGNEDILIHNVDIISAVDFNDLLFQHTQNDAIATLAVSGRQGSRYFLFNKDDELCGWTNTATNEMRISRKEGKLMKKAFSGIQIISPGIFNYMPDQPVFSLVNLYLEVCKNEKIKAYQHDQKGWYDVGKIEDIEFIKRNVEF